MTLRFLDSFQIRFQRQITFIAADSPANARKFRNDLQKAIGRIKEQPLTCRKSIYFDDEQIRDLVFKGYTITFRIKKGEEVIEVFGFTKYQAEPLDGMLTIKT